MILVFIELEFFIELIKLVWKHLKMTNTLPCQNTHKKFYSRCRNLFEVAVKGHLFLLHHGTTLTAKYAKYGCP
jgi:hypothetical protein